MMSGPRFLVLTAVLTVWGGLTPSCRADHLGVTVKKVQDGVEVVGVTPKGLAAQLGLGRTDVITTVNGRDMRTQADVTEALGPKNPSLTIVVLRSGKDRETIRAEVYWPSKEAIKDAAKERPK